MPRVLPPGIEGIDLLRRFDYYEPDNQMRWWHSALASAALATGTALLCAVMYRSRDQAVPDEYVVALGLVAWVAFLFLAGVDVRLPARLRGAFSLLGVGVGFLVGAAAGLGVVLY